MSKHHHLAQRNIPSPIHSIWFLHLYACLHCHSCPFLYSWVPFDFYLLLTDFYPIYHISQWKTMTILLFRFFFVSFFSDAYYWPRFQLIPHLQPNCWWYHLPLPKLLPCVSKNIFSCRLSLFVLAGITKDAVITLK